MRRPCGLMFSFDTRFIICLMRCSAFPLTRIRDGIFSPDSFFHRAYKQYLEKEFPLKIATNCLQYLYMLHCKQLLNYYVIFLFKLTISQQWTISNIQCTCIDRDITLVKCILPQPCNSCPPLGSVLEVWQYQAQLKLHDARDRCLMILLSLVHELSKHKKKNCHLYSVYIFFKQENLKLLY